MINRNEVYQRNQVLTAKPEDLTLMLYNGGVKFLHQAKRAIENKDPAKAHSLIMRTQDILTELMVTLNMEYELSNSLYSLYDYMKQLLVEANMSKDCEILMEVEGMFQELKATWAEAMKSM
ncbi:flagellar export chaperone FliS [Neobacillus mesonae]|uniref:Flagellar export chaperone FliS n=1 Tax=Neobacillus mesonae TaxID=1193713 RepID=A0A3T0I4B1_9BACI|nr:flagellar export chaperone FliS [Neobacillus mesonae]AZU64175.1 flagellar export chaperone FliS [Neobacillus mesonae]